MPYGSVSQIGFRKRVSGVPKDDNVCNGVKVLLTVLNLYAQIKIRVMTFDSNHSVNGITQSIAASSKSFLILQSSQSAQLPQTSVDVPGETIRFNDQFEVSC
jgi:hypothetical protein